MFTNIETLQEANKHSASKFPIKTVELVTAEEMVKTPKIFFPLLIFLLSHHDNKL